MKADERGLTLQECLWDSEVQVCRSKHWLFDPPVLPLDASSPGKECARAWAEVRLRAGTTASELCSCD